MIRKSTEGESANESPRLGDSTGESTPSGLVSDEIAPQNTRGDTGVHNVDNPTNSTESFPLQTEAKALSPDEPLRSEKVAVVEGPLSPLSQKDTMADAEPMVGSSSERSSVAQYPEAQPAPVSRSNSSSSRKNLPTTSKFSAKSSGCGSTLMEKLEALTPMSVQETVFDDERTVDTRIVRETAAAATERDVQAFLEARESHRHRPLVLGFHQSGTNFRHLRHRTLR